MLQLKENYHRWTYITYVIGVRIGIRLVGKEVLVNKIMFKEGGTLIEVGQSKVTLVIKIKYGHLATERRGKKKTKKG